MLRASPWLLTGVYHPAHGTIESPAALLVQRSVLRSQLSAAGCVTWRAELSGADPLTGAPLRRSYTPDSLPVVATLQGGGPLEVSVSCPELRETLRCRVDLERQSCRWEGERSSRQRRAAGESYGRQQSAGWRPTQWRGRVDRRYGQPAGRADQQAAAGVWRVAPVQQRTVEAAQQQPSDRSSQQPSAGHQTEAAAPSWQKTQPNPHRSGVTTSEYNSAAYQQRSDETYRGDRSGATYTTEHSSDYSQYSGDTYPAVYNGYAQRRRDSPDRRLKMLTEDIRLAVWPSFSSCGGAIAGCATCISLLTVLSVGISPAACIGPCSIGGGVRLYWRHRHALQGSQESTDHHGQKTPT